MINSNTNITENSFLYPNISEHALVILPGRGPEALLWIIVDAFLLVAIVTGNSLSIAIILRTRRRRNRNKKSKVKGSIQQVKSKCSHRKHLSDNGNQSKKHERKEPEEMARHCHRPSRSSSFVLSLAMSDLLVGLAMPFHMTFYIQGADRGGSICQDEGITLGEIEWTCLLRFVLIALACSASACNLLAIAVDRYLAIVYPLHYNRYMSKRVAVTIIFSCWVPALVLSTVPAYWNRWKTAKACELDEIFTPQYITCVVPPLFSTVMVALTILYWRIGREARSQLSRLLGADGKGPPWRRCQSGKTYCPSISSNDNQLENNKILNSHCISPSTEHRDDCEIQGQPIVSDPPKQATTPTTSSEASESTGRKLTNEERDPVASEDKSQEEFSETSYNFHALYKIEEESDPEHDEGMEHVPTTAADAIKECNCTSNDHQITSHEQNDLEKHFVSSMGGAKMEKEICDNSTYNKQDIFECLPENERIRDTKQKVETRVTSNILDKEKKPERENISIPQENSIALSSCPITRVFKNLKYHFPAITLANDGKRINYSKENAVHDSHHEPCKLNNNEASENKDSVSLKITNTGYNQDSKIITQVPPITCQYTSEPDFQDSQADQDHGLQNASSTTLNCSQASQKSELILSVKNLDLTNGKSFNNFSLKNEEDKHNCNIKTNYDSYKTDLTKELIKDFNSEARLKRENEIIYADEATCADSIKLQNKILNIKTSNQDGSGDEFKNEISYGNAFQLNSDGQKDKNEYHQNLKMRSPSCNSQDDPRSNLWNIRFPSLTSAGTTVRPISKSTIVVLLVLGTFLLLWMPYLVVCGLLVNGYQLPYNIYRATFSLAMSNSGVNPIIYGWKNAELKRVFLRFILKKWHKCHSKYRKKEADTEPEMEMCDFTDVSFSNKNV